MLSFLTFPFWRLRVNATRADEWICEKTGTLQFTQELCGGVGVTVGGSNASASASASVNATATGDGAASTAPPDSAAGETKGAGGLVVMLGLVMVGWLVVSG